MSWLVIGLSVGFFIGLVLLIVGLRGRRVGYEPRCCKCEYNLTDLTTFHCPECGAELTPKTIRQGLRRRRVPALVAGLLLMLLTVGTAGYRTYAWASKLTIRDYPPYVLVWLAKRDDAKALDEVLRRIERDSLATRRTEELIPIALDRHESATREKPQDRWVRLLSKLDLKGDLTREQRRRYYESGFHVWLKFRPQLRHGDSLQFGVYVAAVGTSETRSKVRMTWRIYIDDELQPFMEELSTGFVGGWGSSGHVDMPQPVELLPGEHSVKLIAKNAFKIGPSASGGEMNFTSETVKEYTLTVLPPDAPDTVRLVDAPNLTSEFMNVLRVRAASEREWASDADGDFHVVVDQSGPAPMDAAFRVMLVSEGEVDVGAYVLREDRIDVGSYLVRKGDSQHKGSSGYRLRRNRLIPGVTYVPVLRPSPDDARLTHDLFEIWGGELRFDPVDRETLEAAAAAPADAEP